ncbi:MAG: DUF2178 domain-containing protein [Methanomassiliicoccales archaeon]|nr:DUF2178 domain-containing protein [Methanomassiliicoccales archaeon]NYT14440.1 DUF2178 domain-containing protein [Methanomassiliicoccales archaeon]
MNPMRYRFYSRLGLIIVALIVVLSTFLEIYALPLIVVPVAILCLLGLRRRVDGSIIDERTYRISELASRRTVQFVGVVTGIGGGVMVTLGEMGYAGVSLPGYAMGFMASFLIFCYIGFYGYYRRKLGEFTDAE